MKKFVSLENLILLTVFLLPAYLIKLAIFGIPSNVLDILMLATIFIWIFKRNKKIKPAIMRNKAVFISAGVIFLGLFISTLLNPNYKMELGIIKSWFVLPFLFAFAAQDIFGKENKSTLFKAYFRSTLVVAIISLVYIFLGKTTYDGRLEAFFNSPNYLMMYLAPGFIIGIFNYKKENLKKALFYIFSLAVIGTAIYLTKSYAGWLSLFAAVLMVSFLIYSRKARAYSFLGILFFLAIIYFQLQTVKFGDLINFNERSSLSSRAMIWQSAEKILADNWMQGIGPGNFQNKYLEYQKYFPPYLEWAVPHPHNLYLTFWLSGGLLGIIGFLSLLFFWMKNFWKKREFFGRLGLLGVFGILIYILMHGFFDTAYFKNDLAVVFWLIILAGLNLGENREAL
jgi:O-antigen ligase